MAAIDFPGHGRVVSTYCASTRVQDGPVVSVQATPLSFDSAPTLTVVIPAYNEGAMVEKTIDSIASALYPPEHLQIVVVDDGSRDDT